MGLSNRRRRKDRTSNLKQRLKNKDCAMYCIVLRPGLFQLQQQVAKQMIPAVSYNIYACKQAKQHFSWAEYSSFPTGRAMEEAMHPIHPPFPKLLMTYKDACRRAKKRITQ